MTVNEIERLAADNAELPEGLEIPEQLLFFSLRELYSNYRNGAVNRDRAKREKSRIFAAYERLKSEYKITEHYQQIKERLTKNIGELYKCGCPNCKKLINIFTGIDRKDIPDDIKEVNARNERLVELVRERSERNAELMTTIDKIRWALDKNDIERAKEIINDSRNN